jgi:hypothetical protein
MACLVARARVFVLLCAAQACVSAPARRPPLAPLETVTVGAVETFGPGLVGTADSGTTVTFAVTAPASVVLVRVWPGSHIEQLYPLRSKDSTSFQRGWHEVHIAPPQRWSADSLAEATRAGGLSSVEQSQFTQCVQQQLTRQRRPAARGTKPDLVALDEQCTWILARYPTQSPRPPQRQAAGLAYYLVLVASDNAQDARHLTMRLAGLDITQSNTMSVLRALPGFLAGADATVWAGYVAPVVPR